MPPGKAGRAATAGDGGENRDLLAKQALLDAGSDLIDNAAKFLARDDRTGMAREGMRIAGDDIRTFNELRDLCLTKAGIGHTKTELIRLKRWFRKLLVANIALSMKAKGLHRLILT